MSLYREDTPIIVDSLDAGMVFGEACAFLGSAYPSWIIAKGPATVLEISVKTIYRLSENTEFTRELIRQLSKKIMMLQHKIERFPLQTVKGRVVYALLDLMERQQSMSIHSGISKTDLAKEVGSSREAVSRVFSSLETDGIIREQSHGIIEIIDKEKFSSIFS